LILGGAGFLGSHLADSLLDKGYLVYVIDKIPSRIDFKNKANKNYIFIQSDFLNLILLKDLISKITTIYHLASTTNPRSSDDDPIYDITSNLVEFVKLLEFLKSYATLRIVFTSSGGAVYGPTNEFLISENHPKNPISSYGITKLAQEKYLSLFSRKYGMQFCILRMGNPFGPGQELNNAQGIIPKFMRKIIDGKAIDIWGDGKTIRDFFYVNDACEALILGGEYELDYPRVFNIGSGVGYSIVSIIEKIENIVGKKALLNFNPKKDYDPEINVLDVDLARRHLKWSCKTTIDEGLENLYFCLRK
jgi:UDP-glucose 4-epimerase